jgi:hypothetical protein
LSRCQRMTARLSRTSGDLPIFRLPGGPRAPRAAGWPMVVFRTRGLFRCHSRERPIWTWGRPETPAASAQDDVGGGTRRARRVGDPFALSAELGRHCRLSRRYRSVHLWLGVLPEAPATTLSFWICPATLVFDRAWDLTTDINLQGFGAFSCPRRHRAVRTRRARLLRLDPGRRKLQHRPEPASASICGTRPSTVPAIGYPSTREEASASTSRATPPEGRTRALPRSIVKDDSSGCPAAADPAAILPGLALDWLQHAALQFSHADPDHRRVH